MSFFVLYSTYKGTLLDISAEPFNSVDITEGQAVKEFHEEMPDITKVFDEAMANMSKPAQTSQTVTMRQARLALYNAGLLETVQAAVAAASPAVQIEWEYADVFARDWPTLLALQTQIGLTDEQVDELFNQAVLL